jgi:PadR family transcriptional regulator, regulatory protein PadR
MSDVLGMFEQAVLIAILRLKNDAYGRAILKEVERRLTRPVVAGAIYTTLDRLEAKGLISSRLGSGTPERSGRPRRSYALEPAGLRALNESRTAVQNIWSGIPKLLKERA